MTLYVRPPRPRDDLRPLERALHARDCDRVQRELQERLAIKEDALNASQLLTQRLINRIVTQKEEISGLKECIDYMCTQIEYDTNNAKKIARTHAARECIEILWAASNCDETITFEELVEEIKVRFGIGDEK